MTPPRAVSVFRDADRIHPNTFRDGRNRHFMAGMAGIANKLWCTETTSLSTNSTCCLRQRCINWQSAQHALRLRGNVRRSWFTAYLLEFGANAQRWMLNWSAEKMELSSNVSPGGPSTYAALSGEPRASRSYWGRPVLAAPLSFAPNADLGLRTARSRLPCVLIISPDRVPARRS
jgi:hypothetical protein